MCRRSSDGRRCGRSGEQGPVERDVELIPSEGMERDEEPRGDGEQVLEGERAEDGGEDAFGERFDEGRGAVGRRDEVSGCRMEGNTRDSRHHVLADSDPPHSPAEILAEGHRSDRVASDLDTHRVSQPQLLPERNANLVVLAQVLTERSESRLVCDARRRKRQLASLALELRSSDEVCSAVQAGLARNARSDGDLIDGEVHLGMRGAEVDLLDAGADERVGVDGKREMVDETDLAAASSGLGEEGNGAGETLR